MGAAPFVRFRSGPVGDVVAMALSRIDGGLKHGFPRPVYRRGTKVSRLPVGVRGIAAVQLGPRFRGDERNWEAIQAQLISL